MNDFMKRLFNNFISGNIFIALCATGMIFTTFLMNGLPIVLSPFTIFLTMSTYLIYNFHHYSEKLNYTGIKKFIFSVRNIVLEPVEKLFYSVAFLIMISSLFFLQLRIFLYISPLAFLALSYSIPLFGRRGERIRLVEIFFFKTPVLALVWGISTTIIPLVEQNIDLSDSFVWLQVISRSLFIFTLCIPFEMRDLERDKTKNIKTFPVVYGIKSTKKLGTVIVLFEIVSHHLMPVLSLTSVFALDLSSLVALTFVLIQNNSTGFYYYKFLVDGTMLVRFLFLFITIHKL